MTLGLTNFDDKPENFWGWKSTFYGATTGLGLSAGEELDILIKWLGKESSEQARRLKAVNIRHPQVGLMMVWQRLEEYYGSPEAIERALFDRLEDFPKVTYKDPHKLRDLGDLLLELEAAKMDGYLPGLSYLDTSRGVAPIVDKLPFNLQDKWASFGSKYKEKKNVAFPPFTVFADFIRREARVKTDPSFNLPPSHTATEKKERLDRHTKTAISVHKLKCPPQRNL